MELTKIADGTGINSFAALQLTGVTSFDDLLGLVRQDRLRHKQSQPFLTLDDIDQAQYTSMHAKEATQLYVAEDESVNDWDVQGVEEAYEARVVLHVEAQLQRPELQRDPSSLRRACPAEWITTLAETNDDPMRVIDPDPQLLRVPVEDPLSAIAGLPNGYFAGDFDIFVNHALTRWLSTEFGYRPLGIGASWIGFEQDNPLTPEASEKLVDALRLIYGHPADDAWEELEWLLSIHETLMLGYTDNFGE